MSIRYLALGSISSRPVTKMQMIRNSVRFKFSEIQMTQDLNSAGDKKQNETPRVPTFVTEELFQGEKEILIDHHGEQYRLSITKNDKLILTK